MSYYGSNYSSSRLLDPYCVGGSRYTTIGDSLFDKKDNFYSSTYSNTYGNSSGYSSDYTSTSRSRPSAYDRYVSYLDELTSGSNTTKSVRNPYSTIGSSSLYDDDSKLPALSSSASSGYRRLTSESYSSNLRGTTGGLSSTGRPLITSIPAYDKFGKELSNYERWKLQQGGESVYSSSESRPLRTRITATEETSIPIRIERETTALPSQSHVREATKEPSPTYSSRYQSSNLKSSGYNSSEGTTSRYSRPSSLRSTVHTFPSSVRGKLSGYDVQDVRGDGGCYYRCLSLYFTGSEDNYNKYRREVVNYIKDNQDTYSSMIKSEVGYASTSDYFSRKMRTDHQEFAETTEIIATCCLYDINVHVLALVPGRHTWEWLHFDPSIGSGKPSYTSRNIYLYNQGSVHFMLCTPK